MRTLIISLFAGVSVLVTGATKSQADQIMVGQCLEFTACYTGPGPTPWSYNLSGIDLTSLELATNVDFIAAQTSQIKIRLGVTSITFTTSGVPVTETLGQFSGFSSYVDPGPFETDIVGSFFIPAGALSGVISGTFGNSVFQTSAGVNLCLGDGPCSGNLSSVPGPAPTPIPAALPLFATGLGLLGLLGWRRKWKSAA